MRNSLDLNPMENCWAYMKHKLKRDHTITLLTKLITAIKTIWLNNMPFVYFQMLAILCPGGSKEVMFQKGLMTNTDKIVLYGKNIFYVRGVNT